MNLFTADAGLAAASLVLLFGTIRKFPRGG
jgi:hypothetical protein